MKENIRFLDDDTPRKYIGSPTRDKIMDLHAHFSEISLGAEYKTTLILSLHPKELKFNLKKRKELLRLFYVAAKDAGF